MSLSLDAMPPLPREESDIDEEMPPVQEEEEVRPLYTKRRKRRVQHISSSDESPPVPAETDEESEASSFIARLGLVNDAVQPADGKRRTCRTLESARNRPPDAREQAHARQTRKPHKAQRSTRPRTLAELAKARADAVDELKKVWAHRAAKDLAKTSGEFSRRTDGRVDAPDPKEEQEELDREWSEFNDDSPEADARREQQAHHAQQEMLKLMKTLDSRSQQEWENGQQTRRVRARCTIASDRLRDQGDSEGDRKLAAIQKALDSLGYTRSQHQRLFHNRFIQAILPKSVIRNICM